MLDGQIYEELVQHYQQESSKPGSYFTGEEELLVPMPFAQSLYCKYLQAMIAAENFEGAKYNQHIALYNSAFGQYRDWIMRSALHKNSGRGFRF